MIVCTQCGFQNIDSDLFCGSCGGFLEWTGEQVAPPDPEPIPTDEAASKRGLRSRIQTVLSLDVAGPPVDNPPDDSDTGATERPGPPGSGPRPPGAGPKPPGGGPRPPGGAPKPPGAGPKPPGAAPKPPGAGPMPPGGPRPPGGGAPKPPAGGAPKPPGGAPRPPGGAPRPPGAGPKLPGAPGPPGGGAPKPPGAARPPGASPKPPNGGPKPLETERESSLPTHVAPVAEADEPSNVTADASALVASSAPTPPVARPKPSDASPKAPSSGPRPTGAGPQRASIDRESSLPTHVAPVAEADEPSNVTVDASALVASSPAPPAARSVAKSSMGKGQATIGASEAPAVAVVSSAPGPVKPAAPERRPRAKRQPSTRKILPGDLICAECGEGNQPARNFCSRCGHTLKEAEAAKRRWWQRLEPRRRRRTMSAGTRPWKDGKSAGKPRRSRGKLAVVYSKVRPVVAGLILLAGLLVGFSSDLRGRATDKIGDAKDTVMSRVSPTYVPLSPISVSASTFDVDHPASNAVDTNTLTAWVALASDGEPTLSTVFDEPFDLERVIIQNGQPEGFKDLARIETIHFVFDTGATFDLVVDDLPDAKDYDIDGGEGVTSVDLFVTSTYSSLTSDELALSEIEFLFRR